MDALCMHYGGSLSNMMIKKKKKQLLSNPEPVMKANIWGSVLLILSTNVLLEFCLKKNKQTSVRMNLWESGSIWNETLNNRVWEEGGWMGGKM